MRKNTGVYTGLILSMAVPMLFYQWLRSSASLDVSVNSPHGHFYVVSIVSVVALTLAIAIGFAGIRLRNLKISFLSLSYVSLAALFVLHGLSTPGLLMHHSSISGNAAQISILLAVFWLWLSSMSSDRTIIRWFSRWQRWLLPVWIGTLLTFCLALWYFPESFQWLVLKENPLKWSATALIVGLNLWTMFRYLQTYFTSRFPLQLAIVYSSGWMILAQLIIVTGSAWKLSWWLYHFLLLASVAAMAFGIIMQYRSSGSFALAMIKLIRGNTKDWIQAYMSPAVKQLIQTTEKVDAYTAGHSYRVALYALKLAEELQLCADQLRAIAQGSLVHDVGKLSIPDQILNKPGKLSAEEWKLIEQHPVTGYKLCRRLGFMQEELSVIRSHHERWDGTGYPDQLSGEDIPLLARVTAVADVYDALTSLRSYRSALSHEEALAHIRSESGKHFDPDCVNALLRLAEHDLNFFKDTLQSSRDIKWINDNKRSPSLNS